MPIVRSSSEGGPFAYTVATGLRYRHASFGSQSVEQFFKSERDGPLPDLGVRTGVDAEEAVSGGFRPGFESVRM